MAGSSAWLQQLISRQDFGQQWPWSTDYLVQVGSKRVVRGDSEFGGKPGRPTKETVGDRIALSVPVTRGPSPDPISENGDPEEEPLPYRLPSPEIPTDKVDVKEEESFEPRIKSELR